MFTQRHTAYKLSIKDLVSNPYIQRDGEVDYVEIKDLQVARARILVTIVNKMTFDNKSGFLVLDDSTETIRARVWENEFKLIDNVVIGDLVDIIGRIGEWNETPQIYPEIIKQVREPDFILLRNAEIIKKIKSGEVQQIPAIIKEDFEIDLSTDEIDINE